VAATVIQVPARALGAALLAEGRGVARALFDERFAEARLFGTALAARGVPIHGICGDVAMLWYRNLRSRLIEERLPLVGLTDRAALFCLEELARDLSMKVCGRIDHSIDGLGNVNHRAVGPAACLDAGHRLGSAPGFGRTMAVLLADPTSHGSALAAQKRTGPFSALDRTTLVSWWIA
jgi:hypothetical protein